MKKKHEREPEQIQYHFEYAIGEDLPVEIYLTATVQEEAIRSFARHCIRFLDAKNLSDEQQEAFLNAVLQTEDSSKHLPGILPVPERLPDLELPQDSPKPSSQEIQETPVSEPKDPLSEDNAEAGGFGSGPSEEQDATELFAPQPSKPDPHEEHKRKQIERESEIERINQHNAAIIDKHQRLTGEALSQAQWLKGQLRVLTFEEHNRWSDKWTALPHPFSDGQDTPLVG
ncbi:MAG: hypothetical protein CBC00_03600 [Verrucomicrobia bacterium TMED40]|jgi:hypothetical protein|nr:MAG: hypothetical protein CBC00_03600 [Verrucomicrobia bacterium TMED40]|tara:strand:- start:687 stop:1373 length:687 start_codon:yes stop_codon:yes gene_type:complete